MESANPVGPVRSAQTVVDVLSAQGVQYVFGVPREDRPVYDALVHDGPQGAPSWWCAARANAAFMAGAVGRLTGTPGVVLVTSGPARPTWRPAC